MKVCFLFEVGSSMHMHFFPILKLWLLLLHFRVEVLSSLSSSDCKTHEMSRVFIARWGSVQWFDAATHETRAAISLSVTSSVSLYLLIAMSISRLSRCTSHDFKAPVIACPTHTTFFATNLIANVTHNSQVLNSFTCHRIDEATTLNQLRSPFHDHQPLFNKIFAHPAWLYFSLAHPFSFLCFSSSYTLFLYHRKPLRLLSQIV